MAKRKTTRSKREQSQERIPWNEGFQGVHEALLPLWGLQILTEVKLGKLHPRADLAIITPHRGSRRWKQHPLWQFVSKQNILEFKSIHDRIEPGDFEMLLVYSLLYRIKYKIPYRHPLSSWLVIPHITPTLRSALKHYRLGLKPIYSGFWQVEMLWPLYIVEYNHLPADTPFASLKIFMQSGQPLQEMLASMLESEQDEAVSPLLETVKLIHPGDLERILAQMKLSEQRKKLDNTIVRLAEELLPERFEQVRHESKLETALQMMARGFDDALISDITGLPIQDIAALRSK